MTNKWIRIGVCCVSLGIASTTAQASEGWGLDSLQRVVKEAGSQIRKVRDAAAPASSVVNNRGTVEVAFSPNQGAEELVLRVIDSAKTDLRVMAYSFTSAKVTSALVRAVKRGVTVYLLADKKHNMGEGSGNKAKSALSTLQLAGANIRLVGVYAIFHDKIILSDGQHLQTGSFNYSQSAATRNSENVIVHWGNPDLAAVYAEHFSRNWKRSEPFTLDF